jgi:hypothetical protein
MRRALRRAFAALDGVGGPRREDSACAGRRSMPAR